jgi:hypothetical protein
VDVTVPWADVAESIVDLASGQVTLRFAEAAAGRYRWLGAARVLRGRWIDREQLETAPR